MAPVVFSGLFVSLWTWKCFMMVVFQNKIIYMPGLPPNSRWEKVQDYGDRLCGIAWREERVKAADGTDLALCVADVELGGGLELKRGDSRSRALPDRHLYILYFQGAIDIFFFFVRDEYVRSNAHLLTRKCRVNTPKTPGSIVYFNHAKETIIHRA